MNQESISDNYKDFAIDLARQAGKIMKDYFQLEAKISYKDDHSPVTEADIKINRLVISEIEKTYPQIGVMGEEESNLKNKTDLLWVCDPIDGTIPFSHGMPISTFSLALVKNGQPILGVAYDPFMDRMFWAEKGKGAFLNDEPIHVSKSTDYETDILTVCFWDDAKYNMLPTIGAFYSKHINVINLCSVIYQSLYVACGEFFASVFPGDQPHDTASLKIIVEEAGGKVTDLFGNEQRYDQPTKGILASNGIVHQELLDIIRDNIKKN